MSKQAAAELRRRLGATATKRSGAVPSGDIDMTGPEVPTVSVLMPAYNAERYLKEALDSIFSQTWRDFEVIVIDDGSTDDSPNILADFSAIFSELRVIRQQNSGISAALNVGLAVARGEFIARMDADDVMLPDRLARQVRFLRAHPDIAFCSCYMNFIDDQGRVFGEYKGKPSDTDELLAMIEAGKSITYTHPTIMARRSILQESGGYDRRFEPCEDIDLLTRMIVVGHPGVIMPELLFLYRVHGASISGRKSFQQAEMLDLVMRNLRATLEGRDTAGPETLRDYRDSLPIFKRAAFIGRLRSEALRQQATYDRAANHIWKARTRLLAAALIEPHRIPKRVLRRLGGVGRRVLQSL